MLPRAEINAALCSRMIIWLISRLYSPAAGKAVAVSTCLFVTAFVHSAESAQPLFTPEAVFEFASRNYETGDYLAAAVEFKRFVHFFPVHPLAAEAGFKAGMSYFWIPRFSEAINQFDQVIKNFSRTDYATEAMFMISRCHAGLNNSEEAIHTLDALAARVQDKKDRDRALYKSGLLRLESGDTAGARAAFDKVSRQNREKYNIGQILTDLDDPDRIDSKNPVLAGIFSVVPGGGYFYCGRYQEAATAFFLTSALAVASWEAFDKDLHALGGLTGLVAAGFYGGGAIGAVSSAHKYNRKAYSDYIRQLPAENHRPGLSLGVGQDSVGVFLSWRF